MTYIQIHKGRSLILLGTILVVVCVVLLIHFDRASVKPGVVSNPKVSSGFNSCAQAKAAGRSNIPSTDPAYKISLDRDRDGIACE